MFWLLQELTVLQTKFLPNVIFSLILSEDGHFAMQHDLLRDLVVYQNALDPIEQRTRMIVEINENSFPDWWTKGDQPSLHPRLLSITTGLLYPFPTWCLLLKQCLLWSFLHFL